MFVNGVLFPHTRWWTNWREWWEVEGMWSNITAASSSLRGGLMLCLCYEPTTQFSMTDWWRGRLLWPSCHEWALPSYRSYSEKKISENIQCEIFQSILEEARESYPEGIVHELISNLPEDLDRNVDAICEMVDNWSPDMRWTKQARPRASLLLVCVCVHECVLLCLWIWFWSWMIQWIWSCFFLI